MWAPTGPASPDASRTQDHGYLAGGNRPHARPHARHPQREGLPGAGRQARQSLERKCSPMTGIAKGTMDAQSVELRVAQRDDAATLGSMLQLYMHDLSAFGLWSIGDDGRFAYPHLPRYWSEQGEAEGRAPFIFFAEGELAG